MLVFTWRVSYMIIRYMCICQKHQKLDIRFNVLINSTYVQFYICTYYYVASYLDSLQLDRFSDYLCQAFIVFTNFNYDPLPSDAAIFMIKTMQNVAKSYGRT